MPNPNRGSSSKQSSNASRISIHELCRQNDPSSPRTRQSVPSIQSLLSQPGSSSQAGSSSSTRPGPSSVKMKRMWTSVEDRRLRQLVEVSPGNWNLIAISLPGRNGKQCRERWLNHLKPDIRKGHWTEEEDAIILREAKARGHQWSKIAKMLPGRSANAVKNHYYSTLTRKYGDQM